MNTRSRVWQVMDYIGITCLFSASSVLLFDFYISWVPWEFKLFATGILLCCGASILHTLSMRKKYE